MKVNGTVVYSFDLSNKSKREWFIRNLRRRLVFQDSTMNVEIHLSQNMFSSKSLTIRVTPKESCSLYGPLYTASESKIIFDSEYTDGFGQSPGTIVFQDLLGNGPDEGMRGKGYGTLCVNLALQVWNIVLNESEIEGLTVKGMIVPTSSRDDELPILTRFWSSFGLKLKEINGEAPWIESPFTLWRNVGRSTASLVNTQLSINDLWSSYHSSQLMPCDESLYQRIVNDFKDAWGAPYHVISQREIDDAIFKSTKETKNIPIAAGGIFMFLIFLIVNMFKSYTGLEEWVAFMSFTAVGCALGFCLSFLPSVQAFSYRFRLGTDNIEDLQRNRKYKLNKYLALIKPLSSNDRGFLYRVVTELGGQNFINNLHLSQQRLVSDSKSYELDLSGDNLVNMLLVVQQLHEYQEQEKAANAKELLGEDFLFGKIGSLSIDDLNVWSEQLADQFEFHINRLLSIAPTNSLVFHSGSSSTAIAPMLEQLKDVARIEIYASDYNYSCSTVGIKIYLRSGVLDLKASWTGYKDYRLEELIAAFFILESSGLGLIGKAFLIFGREKEQFDTFESLMIGVVDLLGEKHYSEKYIISAVAGFRKRCANG